MFFELLKKECGQTLKSLIYWLYVFCLLVFFYSQMGSGSFDNIAKPVPGEEGNYGTVISKEEDKIMESTLGELANNLDQDSWTVYPVGFAKHVTLSLEEKQEIEEIFQDCTGLSLEEASQIIADSYTQVQGGAIMQTKEIAIKPLSSLTYEEFQKQMEKVCQILGPGSDYEYQSYSQGVAVPATYEQALERYENLMEKDKLTGGYARLFADYVGIALGMLPVFAAVTRFLRDKRAQMAELVYVRKASSAAVVLSRYLAMVIMMLLPVLLLSFYSLSQCMAYAKSTGTDIDYFAFLPVVFGWLLPEILAVSAVGMFFTELTDTALGVLVQGVWWFADIFTGAAGGLSTGNFGMHLILRHNSIMGYDVFQDHFQEFCLNRAGYFLLALVLVVLTVLLYGEKRKGRWNFYGKIRSFSERKSAVSSAHTLRS